MNKGSRRRRTRLKSREDFIVDVREKAGRGKSPVEHNQRLNQTMKGDGEKCERGAISQEKQLGPRDQENCLANMVGFYRDQAGRRGGKPRPWEGEV